MSKEINFKTHPQIINILGKELITNDNIAVLELVKNSFDANSKRVDIIFKNIENQSDYKNSTLIIKDSGIGMSENDIVDKWATLAFSSKKISRIENGRILAGNKGVGRISCDRLGKYLTIYSRVKNGDYIKVYFDWKKFTGVRDSDRTLESIKFELDILTEREFLETTPYEKIDHGTILEVKDLNTYWDPEKLNKLKDNLSKLINPNQTFNNDEFHIHIKYLDSDEEVKNLIFEKLEFKTTYINSIIKNKKITTTLYHRGKKVFNLVEKNTYDNLKQVEVNVYYLNPYSKGYFKKQTGITSFNFGSIFFFLNGFRVSPYGEEGDDWLGMEKRKGQGYARFLGTREVIGRIEVMDDEDNFNVISSREGLVRNSTYTQLTKSFSPFGFYYKSLIILEKFVTQGIKWDSPKESLSDFNILKDNWNEENEAYKEDELTKNKRILKILNSITKINKETLISFNIDEDFIGNIVEDQKNKYKKDIKFDITDLANKITKLNKNEVEEFIGYLSTENNEIQELKKILTGNNIVTNDIKYLESAVNNENVIKNLKKRLTEIERKNIQLTSAVAETEEENLFLKSVKAQDYEYLIHLFHLSGISASTVMNYCKPLINLVRNNIEIDKKDLEYAFTNINHEQNKIISISSFATKANFKVKTVLEDTNINLFFYQYLTEVVQPLLPKYINLIIKRPLKEVFKFRSKHLELILIIDNLISNSVKSLKLKRVSDPNSKLNIEIELNYVNKNNFDVVFRDTGIGVKPKNIEKLFNFGFTTTEGSGIGLNNIKKVLQGYDCDIKFNKSYLNGAEFIISFIKRGNDE